MDTTPKIPNSATDSAPPEAKAEVKAPVIAPATDTDKGYLGHSPDATPRDHYTLAGVTSGKPTPENSR